MTAPHAWTSPRLAALAIGRRHRRVDLVSEPAVLALPGVRDLLATLAQTTDVRVVADLPGDLDGLAARADDLRGDALVAVGGGSVLDAAKVLRQLRHGVPGALVGPQRSGLRAVGALPAAAPRLVAVPTTLGTGAEASSGAVVLADGRPLLARGLGLVPDEVWYCEELLAELPPALRQRGAVEVLFRTLGPALEAHGSARLPDLAHRAGLVLVAGDRLARGTHATASLRTIATIGAETHGPAAHRGLYPFGSRVWYVANEATAFLGVTKLDVLPALWLAAIHLSERGDLGWMPPARLRDVRAALGLPDPATGLAGALAGVLDRWGVPTRIELDADAAGRLAEVCLWRWGLGLPMLRRATHPELATLLATASTAPWHDRHLSHAPSPDRAEAPTDAGRR